MAATFTVTVPLHTPILVGDLDLLPTLDGLLAAALHRGEGAPVDELQSRVADILDSDLMPDGRRLFHASSLQLLSHGDGNLVRAGSTRIIPCGLSGRYCSARYFKPMGPYGTDANTISGMDKMGRDNGSEYRALYAPFVRFVASGNSDRVRSLLWHIPGIGKCAGNRGAGAWNFANAAYDFAEDEFDWLLTPDDVLARPVPKDWAETRAPVELEGVVHDVRHRGAWTFPYWQETGPCLIPPHFLTDDLPEHDHAALA